MKRIKVALIGCGRAGLIHARNYSGRVGAGELIAVCDPSEENLNAAQKELNVKYVYTDYQDVMENDEVHAVIVVTPTKYHHDIVIAAAEKGKHIFCEKPMAESAKECDEMIEACRRNHVKLQIGFMRRFDRNFRRTKELIASGAIGRVTSIRSNTYGPSEPKEWMFDVRHSYGPVGEVNSHDFDTMRWYAESEVVSVYAVGHNFRSPEKSKQYPEYYDTCQIILTFENGVIGSISGAQYVKYGYDSRAEILGTSGILKVGSQHSNTVELTNAEGRNISDSVASWRTLFEEAYAEEDNAFIESILENTEPKVTGEDGKMALILVNAGLKSILEKRPVLTAEMEE